MIVTRQVSSLEMNFLTDVVSVNFVRDLIDWTCTDGCLSQLTSPDQGVYLIGELVAAIGEDALQMPGCNCKRLHGLKNNGQSSMCGLAFGILAHV